MSASKNHDEAVNQETEGESSIGSCSAQSQGCQEYLDEGISEGLRRKLERYFNSHEEVNVPAGLYDRVIKEIERVLFEVTLRHTSGNQSFAAKILGINRNTLRRKMQELDVSDFSK